jgi:hypothetical protein
VGRGRANWAEWFCLAVLEPVRLPPRVRAEEVVQFLCVEFGFLDWREMAAARNLGGDEVAH